MTRSANRSPLAAQPPKTNIISLNLHDGAVPTACAQPGCDGEVARYDARGRAWCAAHFPGAIRFTVASHHWQDGAAWLADPNAFTIMIAPPSWAKGNGRNLPFFAAPSELVFGGVSNEEYTERFGAELKKRLPVIMDWLHAHDGPFQHVTLLCACLGHSLDERFCHRYLVAKLLTWLGCSEEPYRATQRQERQVA